MKYSHVREYKVRTIFLKKLYTTFGGETSPRLFSEKSN